MPLLRHACLKVNKEQGRRFRQVLLIATHSNAHYFRNHSIPGLLQASALFTAYNTSAIHSPYRFTQRLGPLTCCRSFEAAVDPSKQDAPFSCGAASADAFQCPVPPPAILCKYSHCHCNLIMPPVFRKHHTPSCVPTCPLSNVRGCPFCNAVAAKAVMALY